MLHGVAGKLPKDELVVVDLDMAGSRADGKTYEGAEKGYIGKRGARGYKASFVYVHAQREVLGCVFDGASASDIHHIDQLLELVKTRIGSPRVKDIVLRRDAAYGKASFVDKLVENGYTFLLKGMHSSSARKYAKRIKYGLKPIWTDEGVWYPEASRWARLKHHVYGQEWKNLIERMSQSLKDRLETSTTASPASRRDVRKSTSATG